MRTGLLFTLLLLTSSAFAQGSPAAVPISPVKVAATTTAPDTLAALHRLFAARRVRRNTIAGFTLVGAAVGTAISPTGKNDFFSTGDYAKLYGVAAVSIIAIDLLFGDDYSRKNEQRAIAAFQERRLSPRLQRRLKASYFR
jgi:hypothetical protein